MGHKAAFGTPGRPIVMITDAQPGTVDPRESSCLCPSPIMSVWQSERSRGEAAARIAQVLEPQTLAWKQQLPTTSRDVDGNSPGEAPFESRGSAILPRDGRRLLDHRGPLVWNARPAGGSGGADGDHDGCQFDLAGGRTLLAADHAETPSQSTRWLARDECRRRASRSSCPVVGRYGRAEGIR